MTNDKIQIYVKSPIPNKYIFLTFDIWNLFAPTLHFMSIGVPIEEKRARELLSFDIIRYYLILSNLDFSSLIAVLLAPESSVLLI